MYDSKEDTLKHKRMVQLFINDFISDLRYRGNEHDASKLESPEKAIFDEYTPKLENCTYGSNEYKTYLKEMKVALDHHYKNNRHHPEKFANGIKDMNLVDLIEMICDWKASTLRHKDGDILKSIELNQSRFGYSDELKNILINTVRCYLTDSIEEDIVSPEASNDSENLRLKRD